MSKYIVKLNDENDAKPSQIVCGYLGNIFGNGEIAEYDMIEANKKAQLFKGAITRVMIRVDDGKTFKFNVVKHQAWKDSIPKGQISIDKQPDFYEEVATKEEIAQAAKELLKAINDNTTALWNPDLEQTTECIVLNEAEVGVDPDNEGDVLKFKGVNETLTQLEKLL